jgi:lipopolysaccharide export system protein LptA
LLIKAALFTLIPMLLSPAAVAEELSSAIPTSTDDDQIEIVADKLITNHAEKFAEFSGNVSASQGTFVINADHLRINYKAAPSSAAQQATGQDSIELIIATGNVKLSIGEFTAEADRAEYDLKTEVLVLTGDSSALKSNRNILTGSKIIVDRKTGQMSVESDPQERVKAVFYPNESSKDEE